MARIDELIHHLQGTSMSLGEACNNLGFDQEDLTMEELEELDNWLFQCDNCGWWYDVGERSKFLDENICDYCYEDVTAEEENEDF